MSIPFDDRGLTLGDGLFETMLCVDGEVIGFEAHVRRLTAGCRTLGLPEPEGELLSRAAGQALADAGLGAGRAAVRLSWTAGSGGRGLARPAALHPRLFAMAAPAPLPAGPATLVTASVRRNEGSPASRLKTLSYLDCILARREAEAAGAHEALMLNNQGQIACAAAANIFWFEGRRLCTPALEAGVLAGTVRAEIIAAAKTAGVEVSEVRAGLQALDATEGVFLTSSLIGVRPVASIDGKDLPQQVEQATVWLRRGRR